MVLELLPMLQIEIGATFWKNHALSLYADHMSGGGVFEERRMRDSITLGFAIISFSTRMEPHDRHAT